MKEIVKVFDEMIELQNIFDRMKENKLTIKEFAMLSKSKIEKIDKYVKLRRMNEKIKPEFNKRLDDVENYVKLLKNE